MPFFLNSRASVSISKAKQHCRVPGCKKSQHHHRGPKTFCPKDTRLVSKKFISGRKYFSFGRTPDHLRVCIPKMIPISAVRWSCYSLLSAKRECNLYERNTKITNNYYLESRFTFSFFLTSWTSDVNRIIRPVSRWHKPR